MVLDKLSAFELDPRLNLRSLSFFFFSLKSFAFQTVVFWDDPWKALKEFGGIHDHYDACENEKLQKTSTSILNFLIEKYVFVFFLLSQLRLVFLENYFLTHFISSFIFDIYIIFMKFLHPNNMRGIPVRLEAFLNAKRSFNFSRIEIAGSSSYWKKLILFCKSFLTSSFPF